MSFEIPLHSLPLELTDDDAVEAAYGSQLDEIRDKLIQGLSVLVECDKQLTLYLYRALRTRLRSDRSHRRRLQLVSGHVTGDDDGSQAMMSLMQRLLAQLQDAVFSGDAERIIVLPHLDVLTTTTRSGLSAETREAAVLLYDNPDAVFVAFCDPSFELPKVIENLFPIRSSLLGIARERLAHLITRREARQLTTESLNPYALYKDLSGTHAVRCRQILSHFHDHVDYDPAAPESAAVIYREIRQMTVSADVELPRVDFDRDVGGYDAVKRKLREEILDLLLAKERSRDSEEIRHIEEIVPKGLIFHGPPGTGKTFFAKAMATALDATILIVPGPELKSRWVGESEANLRRLFAQARAAAPSIIVFDELDSFAAARGTFTGSGVEHSMVNQLLTEMDGFRSEELVFTVGTTNFAEALDPALLRPGRFELQIEIPYPDDDDRRAILEIYLKKFGLEAGEEVVEHLVQRTGGIVETGGEGGDRIRPDRPTHAARYTGDHLYALVRALKREELRRGEGPMPLTREHVNRAVGGRQRSVELQAEEEHVIAVHEAGHAVLAYVLPHCPTIKKVTIATGDEVALGYVMQAVRKNRYVTTEAELLDDICVMLGGRTAEQLCLRSVSMGASNDLQRASHLASLMVEEMGLSPAIGPRTFPPTGEDTGPRVSEKTSQVIDAEIDNILKSQHQRARQLLERYQTQLDELQRLLREKKTLGLQEIQEVFDHRDFKTTDT